MLLKNNMMVFGVIIFICTANYAFAKTDNIEINNSKEQNDVYKVLQSKDLSTSSINLEKITKDFPNYAYTAKILNEDLKKTPNYILELLTFAKNVGMPLDQYFLGYNDSKRFTKDQNGYTDQDKEYGRELLKRLVAQQFLNATSNVNPTYTAYPGAPGSGKTFSLTRDFGINVAKGKFVKNSIIVGPDLIVMAQIKSYQNAGLLPLEEQRTAAMKAAYYYYRDLSNAIANLMLMMAVTDRLNIVHDSTMTAASVAKLLDCLGKTGYKRIGRVLIADRRGRWGALDLRAKQNGGFSLVTTQDALGKAVAAYERIADGSYMGGRFDELSIFIQNPKYYLGANKAVEVAIYDSKINNMRILPGCKKHIDRILSQITEEELKPELVANFKKVVQAWR